MDSSDMPSHEEFTPPDSTHFDTSDWNIDYPFDSRTPSKDTYSLSESGSYIPHRPFFLLESNLSNHQYVYQNNPSQIDEDPFLNDLPGYDGDIDDWDTISTYYNEWEREQNEIFQGLYNTYENNNIWDQCQLSLSQFPIYNEIHTIVGDGGIWLIEFFQENSFIMLSQEISSYIL